MLNKLMVYAGIIGSVILSIITFGASKKREGKKEAEAEAEKEELEFKSEVQENKIKSLEEEQELLEYAKDYESEVQKLIDADDRDGIIRLRERYKKR
jgi:hypothetical protein